MHLNDVLQAVAGWRGEDNSNTSLPLGVGAVEVHGPGVRILLPGEACFLFWAIECRLGPLGCEASQCLALDVVHVIELEYEALKFHGPRRDASSGQQFSRGFLRLYLDTTVIGCPGVLSE